MYFYFILSSCDLDNCASSGKVPNSKHFFSNLNFYAWSSAEPLPALAHKGPNMDKSVGCIKYGRLTYQMDIYYKSRKASSGNWIRFGVNTGSSKANGDPLTYNESIWSGLDGKRD